MKFLKEFMLGVFSLCLLLSLFSGCNTVREEPPVPIEGDFDFTNSGHINWYGRVWYDEENKYMRFDNTVSGFEVNFKGTTLTATFFSQGGARGNCFLSILVDRDIEPENAIRLELENGTASYQLVNLSEGIHTVKVLRSTEVQEAQISALISLETDGVFYTPPKKPQRKIEYYGASSNCGFGSLGNDPDASFSTDNQCGVSSFTYYTSALLKAQSSAFCASGYGLGVGGTKNLIEKYDRYTIYSNMEWDFSNYVPDVVVINLGFNDQKTFGGSIWGEYQIFDLYQECVSELNEEGREKVIAFQLYKPVAGELGDSYHANWKAHKKIALLLAKDINNRLGWGEKISDIGELL
jgi:hypothetical protein